MPPRPAGRDTKPFPGTFLLSALGLQFVRLGHKDEKQRERGLFRGQFRAGTGAGSTIGALSRAVRMGSNHSLLAFLLSAHHQECQGCHQNQTGISNRKQHPLSRDVNTFQKQSPALVLLHNPGFKINSVDNRRQRKNSKNNEGTFDLQDVKTWILKWNMVGVCPICLCFLSPHDITSQQTSWSLMGTMSFFFWGGRARF